MGFLKTTVWNTWLQWPLSLLKQYTGVDLGTGWAAVAVKVVIVILLLLIVLEAFRRTKERVLRFFGKDDWLEVDGIDLSAKQGGAFVDSIEAAHNLEKTIAPLKKSKQYDRLGETFASLNKHKDAAKWFGKAKDRKRAAMEWALAGYTNKAAKLLMKEGDYTTAARFFEETKNHRGAAAAYLKLGNLPGAAASYAKSAKYPLAVKTFTDYFASAKDPGDVQVKAAEECYALLENEAARPKIKPEERTALLTPIAQRFEYAKRYDLAARLFREAGQLAHAGEVYVLAGKLEEGAQCMREAGRTKEAHQIGARFYEMRERWAEAGMAYEGAGDFRRAGDCFGKANDIERAAKCYEKAGEFYGAALACTHKGYFEKAIRLLQQIKETDKTFDVSRALLGRCFYELHDYAHCVATLDNHLLGKRVEHANIDYFYMLALAYEQLGKLEKSQEYLYKIRTVDVGYKDVAQRLSSISSRISMGAPSATPAPGARPSADAQETHVMEMVENLLGGRYRLEQELGRGGMGVVYLARDTQLDRRVALKFLGSLVDDSDEYRQRFVREAKAAARVNHPNIISIYDISASMGKGYIAMEYVEGQNLTRHVREKGRLTPREALNIAIQACSALDAIHKAGIIHRDIKPDNILLAKGGLVKLTDFGLAKAESARITASNVVMGTPAYMSPEQTLGSDVDGRSDIYSIGLVIHEMLTGKMVFGAGDVMQRQQTEVPPPPSALAEDIPPELDAVVSKCLEKDPRRRFQKVEELVAALRSAHAH